MVLITSRALYWNIWVFIREKKNNLSTFFGRKGGVGFSPGGGGGYSQKNRVGVCGPLPKFLTLFMTKICDFPYPIYDLSINLIPYLLPDPKINSLFQTSLKIIPLVQINVEGNIYLLFCGWKEGDMMKK